VIRETIRSLDKVALARVVLTNREHVIALEARDKGLMGMLLRYPYGVRAVSEYFDDIQDVKITKDMLDLAKHIVEQKSGHFEPQKFENHYETALAELLAKKQKGLPIGAGEETGAEQRRQPDGCATCQPGLVRQGRAGRQASQGACGEESGQEAQGKLTCSVAFASLACRPVAVQSRVPGIFLILIVVRWLWPARGSPGRVPTDAAVGAAFQKTPPNLELVLSENWPCFFTAGIL
jgi:hypothetical protein